MAKRNKEANGQQQRSPATIKLLPEPPSLDSLNPNERMLLLEFEVAQLRLYLFRTVPAPQEKQDVERARLKSIIEMLFASSIHRGLWPLPPNEDRIKRGTL